MILVNAMTRNTNAQAPVQNRAEARPAMYSCINGPTTMPYTLEQDLEAAAKAAYDRMMSG